MRNKRRKQVADDRKKRKLVYTTIGILGIIYFTYALIAGDSGLLKYIELRSKKEKLMAETNILKQQNEQIENEISKLKEDPALLEEHARENGLTRNGELIFKFQGK